MSSEGKDIVIRDRRIESDEFYLALQYDSTNYQLPFEFAGYQLFINNDQTPLFKPLKKIP